MTSTQLFAAGHGLSYTTVVYRPLRLESDTVDVPLDRDGWRVGNWRAGSGDDVVCSLLAGQESHRMRLLLRSLATR